VLDRSSNRGSSGFADRRPGHAQPASARAAAAIVAAAAPADGSRPAIRTCRASRPAASWPSKPAWSSGGFQRRVRQRGRVLAHPGGHRGQVDPLRPDEDLDRGAQRVQPPAEGCRQGVLLGRVRSAKFTVDAGATATYPSPPRLMVPSGPTAVEGRRSGGADRSTARGAMSTPGLRRRFEVPEPVDQGSVRGGCIPSASTGWPGRSPRRAGRPSGSPQSPGSCAAPRCHSPPPPDPVPCAAAGLSRPWAGVGRARDRE
jgi:hypothetical protein